MRTSEVPGLTSATLAVLPALATHRCDCETGTYFVEELEDTEMAHLAEHVALELMVLAGSPRTLSGRTTWDWARDGRGVFEVALGYDDDLVCIAALEAALETVDGLVDGCAPDVGATVARLVALRGTAR